MLQIYDRVLPSASHATLIALTGVAVFLLSCFGLLDWVRQRLMTRVALTLHDGAVDAVLAGTYHASLRRARQSGGQPVRDLTTVRQFLNTPSTLAFFDAPWAPAIAARSCSNASANRPCCLSDSPRVLEDAPIVRGEIPTPEICRRRCGMRVVLRGVGAPHAAPLRLSAKEKKDEGQGERLPWSEPGARGNFSNRAPPLT